MAKVIWKGDRVAQRFNKEMTTRMRKAAIFLQGEVKKSINTGQPVKRVGGTLIGLDPSKPGQPPKKVVGTLFRSIEQDVRVDTLAIVGRVGSNLSYARRLELGFTDTDSLGRTVNQAPRPYLRPALRRNRRILAQILGVR